MSLRSPERVRSCSDAPHANSPLTDPYRLAGVFEEINDTMEVLADAGPLAAATFRGPKRAKLAVLMRQLGITPTEGDSLNMLSTLRADLRARVRHPQPRVEVPRSSFFAKRIRELVCGQASTTTKTSAPQNAGIRLSEATTHRSTYWGKLGTYKDSTPLAEYLQGMATLMADPVAYHMRFGQLHVPSHMRHTDHMRIRNDWRIENGHGRALAAACLGADFIATSGMDQWILVQVDR